MRVSATVSMSVSASPHECGCEPGRERDREREREARRSNIAWYNICSGRIQIWIEFLAEQLIIDHFRICVFIIFANLF